MIDKIRYTKTGKRIEIYEYHAKLHQKVVMSKKQFEKHIILKHPEINLEIIEEVLNYPDCVTKQSKSKKEHYYQKKINDIIYFIVVAEHKGVKNLRFILTAFSINSKEFLKNKNIYYSYKS